MPNYWEVKGCQERVFDHENAEENERIWQIYGSELSADFGTRLCGQPIVWGERCEAHKQERRSNNGRRKSDQR